MDDALLSGVSVCLPSQTSHTKLDDLSVTIHCRLFAWFFGQFSTDGYLWLYGSFGVVSLPV